MPEKQSCTWFCGVLVPFLNDGKINEKIKMKKYSSMYLLVCLLTLLPAACTGSDVVYMCSIDAHMTHVNNNVSSAGICASSAWDTSLIY